jgi:hypothetical protein
LTTETLSICQTCGGGLTYHRNPEKEGPVWAHHDKTLEETAGHEAVPDPAKTQTVEVS